MHTVVEELERKLSELGSARAEQLTALVRDAISLAEFPNESRSKEWPAGYFEQTEGALAGERFERPQQGDLPIRETW